MQAPVGFRRARQRPRLFPYLALLTLAVTLLGPLGEQIALAQVRDQAPPVEEAEIPDDEPSPPPPPVAEIPEDEPTPTPPTPPVAEIPDATEVHQDGDHGEDPADATEMPTAAAAPETHTLTISVYRCNHPEFDTRHSSNFQTVIETCTGPGFGTFDIFSTIEVPSQSGQALTFDIGQRPEIHEILQPGYDDPIADCFLYGPDGALVDRVGPGEARSGQWPVGRSFGDIHCNWYQIDRGLGNVYIVNMACPGTAGLFPEPTMDELIQMCTEPAGQRHFLVEHGPGLVRQGVTGGEFNDTFVEAVQTGPIAIRLSDPEGFDRARVFCQVFDTDQVTQIAPFGEVSVDTFRATGLMLVHGQRIHCSWFNIAGGPELEDPGPPPTPTTTPPEDLSTLVIQHHTCPSGYDPMGNGKHPINDCPVGPNGVAFTLEDSYPATANLKAVTGNPVPGEVRFSGLVPGMYIASSAFPEGAETIFWIGCQDNAVNSVVPGVVIGLFIVLDPGTTKTCHWFVVSGAGQSNAQEGHPATRGTTFQNTTHSTHTCPACVVAIAPGARSQASRARLRVGLRGQSTTSWEILDLAVPAHRRLSIVVRDVSAV